MVVNSHPLYQLSYVPIFYFSAFTNQRLIVQAFILWPCSLEIRIIRPSSYTATPSTIFRQLAAAGWDMGSYSISSTTPKANEGLITSKFHPSFSIIYFPTWFQNALWATSTHTRSYTQISLYHRQWINGLFQGLISAPPVNPYLDSSTLMVASITPRSDMVLLIAKRSARSLDIRLFSAYILPSHTR